MPGISACASAAGPRTRAPMVCGSEADGSTAVAAGRAEMCQQVMPLARIDQAHLGDRQVLLRRPIERRDVTLE